MNFKKAISSFCLVSIMFSNIGISSLVSALEITEKQKTVDNQIISTKFIVPQGTTEIVNDQFGGRRDLVDVFVPKSVERLSSGCFYNCVNLRSLIFEDGSVLKHIDEYVFQNCKNLENINLPESLKTVRAHAFWNCSKLPTHLVLPKSLEEIETTAFFNTKIKSVTLPEQCKYQSIDRGFPFAPSFPEDCAINGGTAYDFYSRLTLSLRQIPETDETTDISSLPEYKFVVPQGTTEIGCNEFCQRPDLVNIIIPKSVKKIGHNAFYGCPNLKTVDFEEGSQLKCIDYFAFQCCTALERINFAEGLLQIRAHSFWGCLKLNSVYFPNSIEEIDGNSFFITKLEKVHLPKICKYQANEHGWPNSPSFPDGCVVTGGTPHDFYEGRPFPVKPFVLSESELATQKIDTTDEGKFIVPQGTLKINGCQFLGRTDLVDIVIPKSVKVIAPGAFYLCTNLKSVTFEEGSMLKSVESYAFQNCFALEKIALPEGTIQVRVHAFWACPNLTQISLPESMRYIDCCAFYTTKLTKVTVPSKCKYQSVRHSFPNELSFPKNCVVEGGIPHDFYDLKSN